MIDKSLDVCRLPPTREEDYSEAQRLAREDFLSLRKVGFSGPWHILIRSPELLTHAQRMGEYLRYRCSLAGRLSELAILLVAREWTQDFEFATHAKAGVVAGLSPETVAAIRDGRRLEGLDQDAQILVDFVLELLRRKSVSDTTWARALARFGEQGCVDLCGVVGYYGLLAATMNAARTPLPDGAEKLPRFPD